VNKIVNEEDKEFFINLSVKFPEIGIEVYSGDEVYMIRESKACRVHFEYEHVPIVYATFDEVINKPWNKIMTFYEADYDETALLNEIDNYKSDTCGFAKAGAIIDGIYYRGVELLPKGANKGQGLLELADILGIPKENTFAIGDYYNDFEMLSVAGISSCPVESPDDIKETVDFVAGKCREGAVADFIEYLQNKAI
jgi:hydroxymethylpyrimidine pyrophosphatase-like HAD family hydrolase